MPVITVDEAVKHLSNEVQNNLSAMDLVDIHNEWFAKDHFSVEAVRADPAPVKAKLIACLNSAVEEELVALWGLIVPTDRHVWYNELELTINYNEDIESWLAG